VNAQHMGNLNARILRLSLRFEVIRQWHGSIGGSHVTNEAYSHRHSSLGGSLAARQRCARAINVFPWSARRASAVAVRRASLPIRSFHQSPPPSTHRTASSRQGRRIPDTMLCASGRPPALLISHLSYRLHFLLRLLLLLLCKEPRHPHPETFFVCASAVDNGDWRLRFCRPGFRFA